MRQKSTALVATVALLLTACNADSVEVDAPKIMGADGKMRAPDAEDADLADLAIDTLAAELGAPRDTIRVDTIRSIDWPDSSIGCPQPGAAYLQVITPGHKITLRVNGKFYFVHEAKGRAFVCKARQKEAVGGVTRQRELVWGPQAIEARKDLAARLGVDEMQVRLAAAQGKTWPDASLDCPEAGVTYEPREVEGYVLRLRHGQRDYTYHTDLERVMPCPPITED